MIYNVMSSLECCSKTGTPFKNERNVYRPLVRKSFSPVVMIAHLISVIRNKSNQSIIIHTAFFEFRYYFSYLVVNESDIGIIMFLGIFNLICAKISKSSSRRSGGWNWLINIRIIIDFPFPISYGRSLHFFILISVQAALWRIIRAMKIGRAHV